MLTLLISANPDDASVISWQVEDGDDLIECGVEATAYPLYRAVKAALGRRKANVRGNRAVVAYTFPRGFQAQLSIPF